MAGTPTAGKGGRVRVGGVNIRLDRWKVTTHAIDIPTTNFEDQDVAGETFTSGITGPREGDVEFNGYYDLALLPFAANPPMFVPGVYTPAGGIQLYPKKSATYITTASFNFTSVRVLQAAVDCDVNGRVNLAVSMKSNGVYVMPTTA